MANSALPLFESTAAALDALAASTIPAREVERRIYDLIAPHTGHKNPISIASLHKITGLSERTIKAVVAELICTHRVLIGASRQDPIGYFIIQSDEDRTVASMPLMGQTLQMLRRLRVINGKHQTREWLGQLSLKEDF